MTEKTKEIVLVGDSPIAEVAYEYFTHDSPYEVAAFAVEREFLRRDTLFGLPVVEYETITETYPPEKYQAFVAIGYGKLNRIRARLFQDVKAKGYSLVSYVSSMAFVWRNVGIGQNCFIFENNVVQPFVKIGDNVTLWSGNHIGHHTTIKDHCFISSHVVVSGFVTVEEYCFLGVNATIANNITIKSNCLIGAGATILRDTTADRIYGTEMTKCKEISARERFGVAGV